MTEKTGEVHKDDFLAVHLKDNLVTQEKQDSTVPEIDNHIAQDLKGLGLQRGFQAQSFKFMIKDNGVPTDQKVQS